MAMREAYSPRELPKGLERLSHLALDLVWTWYHGEDELWEALDRDMWERTRNPWLILQTVSGDRLRQLARNRSFRDQLDAIWDAHEEPSEKWFDRCFPGGERFSVGYFCMEYGLGECLPIYAGGLGVLAGDHLKAASDMGVPLVAVGLYYQTGSFRQVLDRDGRPFAMYPFNDPQKLPMVPARDETGAWVRATIDLPGRTLVVRAWEVRIGEIALYLLDTNDPLNSPADRGINSTLYGGGPEARLLQEMVLGIGGWRILEAMGKAPEVLHMNEGHAAFALLERARSRLSRDRTGRTGFAEAMIMTRPGNAFTTHTPVAAGFDRFDPDLICHLMKPFIVHTGLTEKEFLALGRVDPENPGEPFNMATLAVRGSGSTNAVSALHSEVSRGIFAPLYPRWPAWEVPVSHVTNGVHVACWDSKASDRLWTDLFGKERWRREPPKDQEEVFKKVPDEILWTLRSENRAGLVGYVRDRVRIQKGWMGIESPSPDEAGGPLDPYALTLGFARRFTDYKRTNLLLSDPDRLIRLLSNPARPVQVVLAGKAHPADSRGLEMIAQWVRFASLPQVSERVVYLEDYDLESAGHLVAGVDVWINTPRRPWEACGTSGMKVLVNGGLNLSERDGWWDEAYAPEVGWALGDRCIHDSDPSWDRHEAEELYRLLEEEVVPEFYDRDARGIPAKWVDRVRRSMARLTVQFSSSRMVWEYVRRIYFPASDAVRKAEASGRGWASAQASDRELFRIRSGRIHIGNRTVEADEGGFRIGVPVVLDDFRPDGIVVELVANPEGREPAFLGAMTAGMPLEGVTNGAVYELAVRTDRSPDDFTVRVRPKYWGPGIAPVWEK
jgi:starch phosphorylase